jgi:hypothetical protein
VLWCVVRCVQASTILPLSPFSSISLHRFLLSFSLSANSFPSLPPFLTSRLLSIPSPSHSLSPHLPADFNITDPDPENNMVNADSFMAYIQSVVEKVIRLSLSLSLYACTATTIRILRLISSLFYVTSCLTSDLELLIPLSVLTDKSHSSQP